MAGKGYTSRLFKCNDFNVYGVFGRDKEFMLDALRSKAHIHRDIDGMTD